MELGLPIDLVAAVLELLIDLVVAGLELLIDLVAVELGLPIGPVAALEPAPVLAVGPGLRVAQLAAALRTKSVTAAHRPDPVPLLAAEDLAAVAETTREPVAAEAAIAWAAAE